MIDEESPHPHGTDFNGTPGPHWSDEALIRHMQRAEDEHTFKLIYARYQGWVFRKARSIVGETYACDASQKVFLYLLRKFPELQPPYNLPGLLSQTVLHTCTDLLRKEKRYVPLDQAALELIPAEPPLIGMEIDPAEFWAQVEASVTITEYRVLWLRFPGAQVRRSGRDTRNSRGKCKKASA
jgi:hypothetical protein